MEGSIAAEHNVISTTTRTFGQHEVQAMHVGLLLFGKDFLAIRQTLMPQYQVWQLGQTGAH